MSNLHVRIVRRYAPGGNQLAEAEIDLGAIVPGLRLAGISVWNNREKPEGVYVSLPGRPGHGSVPPPYVDHLVDRDGGKTLDMIREAVLDAYFAGIGKSRNVSCAACGIESRETTGTCPECGSALPKPAATARASAGNGSKRKEKA